MLESEGLQPSADTDTLVRILNRTASLLQAKSCGVFIWDRDRNLLTPMRPFSGVPEDRLQAMELALGATAMGTSVHQDRPILLDARAAESEEPLLKELNCQNAVVVPLALERRDDSNEVIERSIMGTFCAFDKYYGRPFDMEDARLLSMMARQASAVLVTSQLYWKEVERVGRLQSILESTSVGLMAVSPKGTVTQVNAAARRALGLEDDSWFGRPYRELISRNELVGMIAQTLAGDPPDEPKELAIKVRNSDGEMEDRIYRIQMDQIRSEDRQSLGWVMVLENVTDIRRAEQMMSAFVDMISHELRTPLTSIRGFVATLIQAGEGFFDWMTQQEFLQIVDTEAERLGGMIDEQLNIARIQNGRGLQYHFQATQLRKIVEQVIRLQSQSSAMKGGHKLVVDIPEGFPEIVCDDSKLTQVLHNLVGNALKYSPNGGEVRIVLRQDGDGVLFTVIDQGVGIPPEQLPKMFGQFFRVDSSNHTGIKGTGLGLWLTKHMVEGMGGKIWVESDYGHGSHFKVWIPNNPPASATG